MAVYNAAPAQKINLTYQFSTTNKSFLNMHYFLKQKGIKNKIEIKLLAHIKIENKIEVLSNIERRIIKKEIINSETEKPHVNLTKASIKVEIQIKINKEISGNNSTSFNGIRM